MRQYLLYFYAVSLSLISLDALAQKEEVLKDGKKRVIKGAMVTAGLSASALVSYHYLDAPIRDMMSGTPAALERTFSSIEPLGRNNLTKVGITSFFIAGALAGEKSLQRTSVLWLGTFLLNDLVVSTGKRTFQRYRPETGYSHRSFDGPYGPNLHSSFPSQHTANAFAAATIINYQYGKKWWVPPAAYGIASLVALERIVSHKHYTSDVLIGALTGMASAWVFTSLDRYIRGKTSMFFRNKHLSTMAIDLVLYP